MDWFLYDGGMRGGGGGGRGGGGGWIINAFLGNLKRNEKKFDFKFLIVLGMGLSGCPNCRNNKLSVIKQKGES